MLNRVSIQKLILNANPLPIKRIHFTVIIKNNKGKKIYNNKKINRNTFDS